ncbi:MAG: hypothetical protein JRE40_00215 [Deltaproteobacteria bacterium]|nr:hypothetical protein [Deltaproteobacteria bacterium]
MTDTQKNTKKIVAKILTSDNFATSNRYLAYLQAQYINKKSLMSKSEIKSRKLEVIESAIVVLTFNNDKMSQHTRVFNSEKLARRFMRHAGYRVLFATKTRDDGKTLFAHNLDYIGKNARIKNVSERRDYESNLWKILDDSKKEVSESVAS